MFVTKLFPSTHKLGTVGRLTTGDEEYTQVSKLTVILLASVESKITDTS